MNKAEQNEKKPPSIDEAWLLFEATYREYQALKTEQNSRIGFRDNLLYVNLTSVGALLAYWATNRYSLQTTTNPLLLIPWINVILGWTYLVNDNAISRIGEYIRTNLTQNIKQTIPNRCKPFEWESFHRSDIRRKSRKTTQLIVDLFAFPIAGIAALLVFLNESQLTPQTAAILSIETVLLCNLTLSFIHYADTSN